MQMLCPKCHFIGKGKFQSLIYQGFFANILLGIFLIAISAMYFWVVMKFEFGGIQFDSPLYTIIFLAISFIIMIAPLVWGIINIKNYLQGGNYCPGCNSPGLMSLEDPAALEIIEDRNLEVPK